MSFQHHQRNRSYGSLKANTTPVKIKQKSFRIRKKNEGHRRSGSRRKNGPGHQIQSSTHSTASYIVPKDEVSSPALGHIPSEKELMKNFMRTHINSHVSGHSQSLAHYTPTNDKSKTPTQSAAMKKWNTGNLDGTMREIATPLEEAEPAYKIEEYVEEDEEHDPMKAILANTPLEQQLNNHVSSPPKDKKTTPIPEFPEHFPDTTPKDSRHDYVRKPKRKIRKKRIRTKYHPRTPEVDIKTPHTMIQHSDSDMSETFDSSSLDEPLKNRSSKRNVLNEGARTPKDKHRNHKNPFEPRARHRKSRSDLSGSLTRQLTGPLVKREDLAKAFSGDLHHSLTQQYFNRMLKDAGNRQGSMSNFSLNAKNFDSMGSKATVDSLQSIGGSTVIHHFNPVQPKLNGFHPVEDSGSRDDEIEKLRQKIAELENDKMKNDKMKHDSEVKKREKQRKLEMQMKFELKQRRLEVKQLKTELQERDREHKNVRERRGREFGASSKSKSKTKSKVVGGDGRSKGKGKGQGKPKLGLLNNSMGPSLPSQTQTQTHSQAKLNALRRMNSLNNLTKSLGLPVSPFITSKYSNSSDQKKDRLSDGHNENHPDSVANKGLAGANQFSSRIKQPLYSLPRSQSVLNKAMVRDRTHPNANHNQNQVLSQHSAIPYENKYNPQKDDKIFSGFQRLRDKMSGNPSVTANRQLRNKSSNKSNKSNHEDASPMLSLQPIDNEEFKIPNMKMEARHRYSSNNSKHQAQGLYRKVDQRNSIPPKKKVQLWTPRTKKRMANFDGLFTDHSKSRGLGLRKANSNVMHNKIRSASATKKKKKKRNILLDAKPLNEKRGSWNSGPSGRNIDYSKLSAILKLAATNKASNRSNQRHRRSLTPQPRKSQQLLVTGPIEKDKSVHDGVIDFFRHNGLTSVSHPNTFNDNQLTTPLTFPATAPHPHPHPHPQSHSVKSNTSEQWSTRAVQSTRVPPRANIIPYSNSHAKVFEFSNSNKLNFNDILLKRLSESPHKSNNNKPNKPNKPRKRAAKKQKQKQKAKHVFTYEKRTPTAKQSHVFQHMKGMARVPVAPMPMANTKKVKVKKVMHLPNGQQVAPIPIPMPMAKSMPMPKSMSKLQALEFVDLKRKYEHLMSENALLRKGNMDLKENLKQFQPLTPRQLKHHKHAGAKSKNDDAKRDELKDGEDEKRMYVPPSRNKTHRRGRSQHTLPPKILKRVPKREMKTLDWQPIEADFILDTQWKSIDDSDIKIPDEFEILFSVKAKADEKKNKKHSRKKSKRKGRSKKGQSSKAPISFVLHNDKRYGYVLTEKRCSQVLTALRKIRLQPKQIREAILNVNESLIGKKSILYNLLEITPNLNEQKYVLQKMNDSIANQSNSKDFLNPVEYFFYQLADVSHLELRLQLWIFKLKFQETMDERFHELYLLLEALKSIQRSSGLVKILQVILAFGNFMNAGLSLNVNDNTGNSNQNQSQQGNKIRSNIFNGSNNMRRNKNAANLNLKSKSNNNSSGKNVKVGVYGFSLHSLKRLALITSNDSKYSLLSYVYKYCRDNYTEALDCIEELKGCSHAVQIATDDWYQNVMTITDELSKFHRSLRKFRKAAIPAPSTNIRDGTSKSKIGDGHSAHDSGGSEKLLAHPSGSSRPYLYKARHDQFADRMKIFYKKANGVCKTLLDQWHECITIGDVLCQQYDFGVRNHEYERLIRIFADFISDLKKARIHLENEEYKAKQQQKKQERRKSAELMLHRHIRRRPSQTDLYQKNIITDMDYYETRQHNKEESKKELSKLLYEHSVLMEASIDSNDPQPMSVQRVKYLKTLAKSNDLPNQNSTNPEASQRQRKRRRSLTATGIHISGGLDMTLAEDQEMN